MIKKLFVFIDSVQTQGSAGVQFNLGYCYQYGIVERDIRKTVELYCYTIYVRTHRYIVYGEDFI